MSSHREETAPSSTFAPGTWIAEKFEIRGLIGEGGMGMVFDAWHASIGRRVAIKILREHQMGDPSARERFRQEALMVAQLQHPNIVTMHDVGVTDDGHAYLVFEFLSGKSLSSERGKALDVGRTIKITRQICRALTAAHSVGIVHRDLKPSNVHLLPLLESETDFVKLLDFGIAKSLQREREGGTRLTSVHQRVGTPRYMAPEQIRDSAVDHRADLYSLGCLLFEMLTGSPPFKSKEAPKLVQQHLTQAPPLMCSVRPDLRIDSEIETIARILLQKMPEDRFQSASAVEAALEDCATRAKTEGRAPVHSGEPPETRSLRISASPNRTATDGNASQLFALVEPRDELTEPSSSFAIDETGSELVADSAVLEAAPLEQTRETVDPTRTRAERPRSTHAPELRSTPSNLWLYGSVAIAAVLAVLVVSMLVYKMVAPVPIVVPAIATPKADQKAAALATTSSASKVTHSETNAAGVLSITQSEPTVRILSVRVEHGPTDSNEAASILRTRARDITRCFAQTQASRAPTLRLGFMSSEGSTTIRATPNNAASQRVAACVAALEPPIPLPVSQTRAVYLFSVEVGSGVAP